MRTRSILFLMSFLVLALTGCAKPSQQVQTMQFQSEYGFSFSYPSGWLVVERDLPDQWAITKGADTIIFTINDAVSSNLLTLGVAQAQRDIHPNATKVEMEQLMQIVGLASFNGLQWYTYAIEFEDKGVDSIVSGIVCNDKEINMVLVSAKTGYEVNRQAYLAMLESFRC